jgi:lipoprotein-releasing system ATP-binding protein
MTPDLILEVQDLRKSYIQGEKKIDVLSGVFFSLRKGEIACLMGESGAGKTTLFNLLGLLDNPDQGKIVFNGQETGAMGPKECAAFRNRVIGFLFQFHFLLSDFTALENVMMPGLISGKGRESLEAKAGALLKRVGLGHRLHHHPKELSGGEQQRVAMVRALMNEPLVVLADEPTGNLDERNSDNFLDLAFEMVRETGRTFFIATHSQRLANRCDRVYHLAGGKVE